MGGEGVFLGSFWGGAFLVRKGQLGFPGEKKIPTGGGGEKRAGAEASGAFELVWGTTGEKKKKNLFPKGGGPGIFFFLGGPCGRGFVGLGIFHFLSNILLFEPKGPGPQGGRFFLGEKIGFHPWEIGQNPFRHLKKRGTKTGFGRGHNGGRVGLESRTLRTNKLKFFFSPH